MVAIRGRMSMVIRPYVVVVCGVASDFDAARQPPDDKGVLGFFSIQEKAIFNTRYHYISLHITLLSLCIIVYHCRYHNISCPSATHDINDIDDT